MHILRAMQFVNSDEQFLQWYNLNFTIQPVSPPRCIKWYLIKVSESVAYILKDLWLMNAWLCGSVETATLCMLSHMNPQGDCNLSLYSTNDINMPYIVSPLKSLIHSQFDYIICLVAEDTNTQKRTKKHQSWVTGGSFTSHNDLHKEFYDTHLSVLHQLPVFFMFICKLIHLEYSVQRLLTWENVYFSFN